MNANRSRMPLIITIVIAGMLVLLLVGAMAWVAHEQEKNRELMEALQAIQDDDLIMRMTFYPSSGGSSDNYLFEVRSDGTLLCQFGTKAQGRSIQSKEFFQNVAKSGETRLTNADMQAISVLLDELDSEVTMPDSGPVLDSWDVTLYYNGKTYVANYYAIPSKTYQELVDKLTGLSPIAVDLHGWS